MSKGRSILGPDSKLLSVIPCDITSKDQRKLRATIAGADVVIISSSYTPANGKLIDIRGASKVDNLGNKRIIDTCAEENIPKIVLISSLLTNGLLAGQLLNPQYLLLNAFGGILLQKL